ncbi:MAG: hypothetical protein U0798_02935 [Gemmataceae bacterium]
MIKNWNVILLPNPKKSTDAIATGFCGTHPVGLATNSRGGTFPCWWPNGQAMPIEIPGYKDLELGHAKGHAIPITSSKKNANALVMQLVDNHELSLHVLSHPKGYSMTGVYSCADEIAAGMGKPKSGKDSVPLLWRKDGTSLALFSGDYDGYATATDGKTVGGWVGFPHSKRAILWSIDGEKVVDLTPQNTFSAMVNDVDGNDQVGCCYVETEHSPALCQAALWHGSADTHVNLTPNFAESATAKSCAPGCQVGSFSKRDRVGQGETSCLTRAILWHGNADNTIDLHGMLPPEWNASAAFAVERSADQIRIAGEASLIEVTDPNGPNERHTLDKKVAVLWVGSLNEPKP